MQVKSSDPASLAFHIPHLCIPHLVYPILFYQHRSALRSTTLAGVMALYRPYISAVCGLPPMLPSQPLPDLVGFKTTGPQRLNTREIVERGNTNRHGAKKMHAVIHPFSIWNGLKLYMRIMRFWDYPAWAAGVQVKDEPAGEAFNRAVSP